MAHLVGLFITPALLVQLDEPRRNEIDQRRESLMTLDMEELIKRARENGVADSTIHSICQGYEKALTLYVHMDDRIHIFISGLNHLKHTVTPLWIRSMCWTPLSGQTVG